MAPYGNLALCGVWASPLKRREFRECIIAGEYKRVWVKFALQVATTQRGRPPLSKESLTEARQTPNPSSSKKMSEGWYNPRVGCTIAEAVLIQTHVLSLMRRCNWALF